VGIVAAEFFYRIGASSCRPTNSVKEMKDTV